MLNLSEMQSQVNDLYKLAETAEKPYWGTEIRCIAKGYQEAINKLEKLYDELAETN